MSDDLPTVTIYDGPAREEAPGYAVPEPPECEGSCDPHSGAVLPVYVTGADGYDWGEFNYCAEARAEDERRGFVVELLAERKPAPRIDWPRALGTDVRGAVRRLRREG